MTSITKQSDFSLAVSLFLSVLFLSLLIILSLYYLDLSNSNTTQYEKNHSLADNLEFAVLDDDLYDISLYRELIFTEYSYHTINRLPNNSNIPDIYLLRVKVQDIEHYKQRVLFFENSLIDRAIIYLPYEVKDELIYRSNVMTENLLTLYTILPDGLSRENYLYIITDFSPNGYNLKVGELDFFLRNQSLVFYYIVVNIGIIFSMIFANLYLFFKLKETLYLLHALFLLSFLHLIMSLSGVFELFSISYSVIGIFYWTSMTFLTLSVFFYYLLDINSKSRTIRIFFISLILLSVLSFSIKHLNINYQLSNQILSFFGLYLILSLFACTIYIHLKCKTITNYILFALTIMGTSGVIMLLAFMDIFSVNIFFDNIAVFGISIESFLFTMSIAQKIKCAYLKIDKLKLISSTDKLTNLYNRGHFDRSYMRFLSYSLRYNQKLSVVMFDLDHFKHVNDTYGHHSGDLVLKRTADLLLSSIRHSDMAFRWGGEEFLVLLPNTKLAGAARIAEKLRDTIEGDFYDGVCRVTASFGVIEILENEPFEEWFSRLDLVLYKAKREGRNQVVPCFNCMESKEYPFMRIEWSSTFECNHALIDEQHKNLFDKINKLLLAFQTGVSKNIILEEIDDLIDHVKSHFKEEEMILKAFGYEKLIEHSNIHKSLLTSAQSFRKRIIHSPVNIQEIYTLLYGEIIMGHLISEDFKFFSHIQKQMTDNF